MTGHRERLRKKFKTEPILLTEAELVELLLTYAIPRRDVAPEAKELLERFGTIGNLLEADYVGLSAINGIGEQAAILLRLIAAFAAKKEKHTTAPMPAPISEVETIQTTQPLPKTTKEKTEIQSTKRRSTAERTFTNDLAQAALDYVPLVTQFTSLESYKQHLIEVLPYNSAGSRQRYASNLLNRYFQNGLLQTPLVHFLSYEQEQASREAVLFYETVLVEETLKIVAERSIWPALPAGRISREQLRNFLNSLFPDVSAATMQRMLYSLFNVYTVLNGARAEEDTLFFHLRKGTLPAFLYILCAEFPKPGIYSMDALEASPMRRWLLWDRDWMRRQLYNLQDLGVLSKVTEIDSIRQFTMPFGQMDSLHQYFRNPQRSTIALREKPS